MGNFAEFSKLEPAVEPMSERALHGYVGVLTAFAVFLGTILALTQPEPHKLWAVAALGAVAAVSERGRVRLSQTTETSIALVPVIFAAVVLGPFAALVVGALSLLGDVSRPYLKLAVYTSTRALTGAIAGFAALAAASAFASQFAAIAFATLVAAVVAEATDTLFAAITHRVRGNGTVRNAIRVIAPLVLAALPMYVPVVAILAAAYLEVSAWTLPLFFVPALAAQRLFTLYQEQRDLTQKLQNANLRLERANLSFATALVATLEARDQYTAGHSAAVALYARDIAARMGLSQTDQELARVCGLVHDIGKIGLPASLLEKAGPLTLEERRRMEQHSVIGERILANVEDYEDIARVVRHHHERVDGNGYPDRLGDDGIPLLSKIIAVADAYNAMTSHRPYRDAMPSRVARLRLAQAADSQFDTSVVAAFEAILAGASEDYRLGLTGDDVRDEPADVDLAATLAATATASARFRTPSFS